MKPRSVLVLSALGVAVVLGLVVLVPRVVTWFAPRTPTVARPSGSTPQIDPAVVALVELDSSRPREHALAVENDSGLHRITLLDEAGRPVTGALAWTEASRNLPQASDAAGGLRFPEAGVDVYVTADGFVPRRLEVPEEPLEVQLERDPGLALTLHWNDGAPVVGARVRAVFEAPDLDPARVARLEEPSAPTDANGRTTVRPWQIGLLTARLRVDTPDSGRVWLRLPDDIDHFGPAAHTARLERGAIGHRVRIVDAESQPLADRTVTFHVLDDDVGHTDAEGWVSFGDQARLQGEELRRGASYTCNYVIESGAERVTWFEHGLPELRGGEERTLRVAPLRVFGRVESPAPSSYLVATAATMDLRQVANAHFHPEELDELFWQPVRDDGSFEVLEGWQGPESVVVLRHRELLHQLWVEPVPAAGGPVLLHAPAICRVSIVSRSSSRAPGLIRLSTEGLRQPLVGDLERSEGHVALIGFQVLPGSFEVRLDLPELPPSVEVPCGRYSVTGQVDEYALDFDELDATGSTAILELDVPELVTVRGRIAGSMRGPLAGLSVLLDSDDSNQERQIVTDREGCFEAQVLARAPVRVVPAWNDEFNPYELLANRELEPELDSANPEAHYVIEEALVRVIERPPSPLLRHELCIEVVAPTGVKRASTVKVALDDDGCTDLYVPLGTYRLRRRFSSALEQDVQVTLEASGEREVVLDSSAFAALALSVTVSDPERRELRLRARDARGFLAALDVEHRLGDDPYEFLKVVEPGTYAVEVESRIKGAPSSDEPLDVWRGEFTAVPGAQVPLRIHLR